MSRSAGAPALICALYSEDRSATSRQTLRAIARGMFLRIHPGAKTNHISFAELARGVTGSSWKSYRSRQKGAQLRYRNLLKAVATALQRGQIVLFHVDGDARWSEQEGAEVWRHLQRFRQDLENLGVTDEYRAVVADRFLAVIPFYSIESWTFANTALLRTKTSIPEELTLIERWAADLGALDEERQIKERLPSIRDRYNAELAAGIPTENLEVLGASYAAALARLRESETIQHGLAETVLRPW